MSNKDSISESARTHPYCHQCGGPAPSVGGCMWHQCPIKNAAPQGTFGDRLVQAWVDSGDASRVDKEQSPCKYDVSSVLLCPMMKRQKDHDYHCFYCGLHVSVDPADKPSRVTNEQSETPRTDALQAKFKEEGVYDPYEALDFARSLECELTDAKDAYAGLKGATDALARSSRAEVPDGWSKVYDAFVQKCHDEAAKFKRENDMYGWNFHEGMASGAINMDIELRKLLAAGTRSATAQGQFCWHTAKNDCADAAACNTDGCIRAADSRVLKA